MSSINSGYRGNRPAGGTENKDDKNLSDVAKDMGLFQNSETGDTDDAKDGGKSGKAGKGGKAGRPGAMHGGMSTKNDSLNPKAGAGTANDPSTLSVLPDPSQMEPSTVDANALDGLEDSVSPKGTSASIEAAHTHLAADIADPKASTGTLTLDMNTLAQEMTAGGITTPISQVVNDLVDPEGTGAKPSANLVAAAKAQGIDLSVDNVDVAQAQKALDTSMALTPANPAAITLDVNHVIRANALAGTDGTAALTAAATKVGSSNYDPLAALYAAAAKNGIDLTGKGADASNAALNDKATKAAQRKAQAEAAAAREAAAAATQNQQYTQPQNTNAGGSTQAGGSNAGGSKSGGSTSGGGGGTASNNAGNTSSSKGNYAAVASTGSGRSAGGWDTSGNQSIEPNTSNPVDFAKDYNLKGGFTSISLDDMLAKVPQLTASYPDIKNILTTAAASSNPAVPPQLLLSTLGVETSFAQNFGTNAKDGPFQFIESTFAAYGSGDRTNMADAAKACANYYSTLLQENGGDLFAAMRDYNGDVTQGASNSYQKDQQDMFNGNMEGS